MQAIVDERHTGRKAVAIAVAAVLASWQGPAAAQEEAQPEAPAGIEQVVVTGRYLSASQRLVGERLNDASVTDMLGADTISRLGDSSVAAALRRIPGLSLVGDKYVYIRGLGERYSASSLNGAQIPSPDLTRNVIPLDIFPTSIVQSLRVQKAWSPDLPANFAGGNVDIRTKGIPDDFTLSFEVGSGFNSENSGTMLSYPGGSRDDLGTDNGERALSGDLLAAVHEFQGNVNPQRILSFLRRQDPSATLAEAEAVNRQLALELNRQIGLEQKDTLPDVTARASIGKNFELSDDWELGFLAGGAYVTSWREAETRRRNVSFPEERIDNETESTHSVDVVGTLNFGLGFTEDHRISTTTLFLRNTDDETAISDFFNENREKSDGRGFRDYTLKFEERNMVTNQVNGTHYLGDATRSRLPSLLEGLVGWLPEETALDWFYSESEARTDIPNEVSVSAETITDPDTAEVLQSAVGLSAQAADYRFTDLDDEVINHGWAVTLPFEAGRSVFELKGGYDHSRKARTYRQTQFRLGALGVSDPSVLEGPLDEVFSDENILDPDNDFVFDRTGSNNQSYIAATMTDAVFGMVDWTYDDTWRVAAGARWEDYRQVALEWNPYGYSATSPQVTTDPEALEDATFTDDRVYPAVAFTWMSDLWAETFQLRLGWSETTVRPDLREITDALYIDDNGDGVRGNSNVVPADVDNYDLRAEWFFGNGDNLTATLFRKEIANPIEFFESAASDTTTAREIINAQSAEVQGIEIEGLKKLGFLGPIFEPFFLQGNVTLQESEIVAGPAADVPTNPVRPLTGASEYVTNLMLGFDSPNARHSASLVYNVFGERLYVAGRNGAPDGYEQPFHSMDMTWSWYPSETMTFKLKARNLLGETVTIERAGVITYEEEPGTSYSLSFEWAL